MLKIKDDVDLKILEKFGFEKKKKITRVTIITGRVLL